MKQGPLASEAVLEHIERQDELKRRQYDDDLRAVMATPSGRRFMFRLLEDTGNLRGTSFTGDALLSAFNEGRRSVAVFLANECSRVAPADYVAMSSEQLDYAMKELAAREHAEKAAEEENG